MSRTDGRLKFEVGNRSHRLTNTTRMISRTTFVSLNEDLHFANGNYCHCALVDRESEVIVKCSNEYHSFSKVLINSDQQILSGNWFILRR